MKAALLLGVGVVGLIETLVPRAFVRLWTTVLYRDAGDAEPREFVYAIARAEGAILLLASMFGLFRLATAASDDDDEPDDAVAPVDDPSAE